MIISNNLGTLSPIILSVLLIAYLILFELGNEKIRHALRPFVIVLTAVFFISALLEIISIYVGIK